jgi:TolA-binding protein
MATMRLLALAAAGKDADASALADHIGSLQVSGVSSLARGGTLFGPLAAGDTAAVLLVANNMTRIGGGDGSALAQLALGRALLLKKEYAGALRAFLTVKVFYPSVTLLQPAALLGASSAYIGINDNKRAAQSLREISEDYPESFQVPEAKKRALELSNS